MCLDRSLDDKGGFRFALHDGCADPTLGEVDRNAESTRLAIEFVKEHPGREALQIVRRLWLIFGNDNEGLWAVERGPHNRFLPDGLRTTLRRTADGYYVVVLALAVVGLGLLVHRAVRTGRIGVARASFAVLPFLALTSTAALLWGAPRFRLPTSPFLAMFASVTLVTVARRRVMDSVTSGH